MTVSRGSTPAGLNAADAELFGQLTASKRASSKGRNDPVYAAQCSAEAAGLDAMAAVWRDPNAREVPVLRQGRDGEIAPLDDPDRP